MQRPLAGLRVVALEQAIAMPFCTFVLAELGAEVIKIERPGTGDVVRGWDDVVDGLSSGFVWVNAGKLDVAIDLSRQAGREIAQRLALTADVFVENFAPGVAERLDLGHARLREANPGLIYCSLSGYGQTGPYRNRKAYDLLIQGEAGFLATTGYPDAPAKVGVPIADLIAGANSAMAILAAVHERERTSQGTYLDVAMFDSVLSWLGYYPHYYWHGRAEPARSGMRHQFLCPYGPFAASDGRLVNVVVASERDWKKFCELVIDRPEWLGDPRFAGSAARTANRSVLEPLIEQSFREHPAEHWESRLEAAELAYARVRSIREVMEHPQVAARRMAVEAEGPSGKLDIVRFATAAPDVERRVPALGEHTRQVLTAAGYDDDQIDALAANGVI